VVSAVLLLLRTLAKIRVPDPNNVEVVMFTTVKRQRWLASTLRFVPVIAIAAAAMIAMAPTEARAQAFNVNKFTCSATPFGVDVDVSGLGNTDICVVGTANIDLSCACAGGGGNCTNDAKKATTDVDVSTSQEVESKNGRAIATVTVPFSTSDTQCTTGDNPLTCPSGQTAKLVEFAASETFQLCTSNGASPCGCATELDTITCDSSGTPFPGKRNSCSSLFP
jgi:hypothetical protein